MTKTVSSFDQPRQKRLVLSISQDENG